jgi:predicted nucleotidyltransferase
MSKMNDKVIIPEEKLALFCRERHISKLSIFGSALTENFGPNSDIDVLVEFEQGYTPGLSFFRIESELSSLFGHKVDLNTEHFLSRYFRKNVLQHAEVQYAAG